MQKRTNGLVAAANWVVRIVGCAIFAFLICYALRYTQSMPPEGQEIPLNARDSIVMNTAVTALAVAGLGFFMKMEGHITHKKKQIILWIAVGAAMIWMEAAGILWVTMVDRVPEGDQAFVYSAASYFLEGEYAFFRPGGYCDMFPYQLGLVAFMELFFLVVGAWNYHAFQFLCVQLIVGIVWLGYAIVRNMTERMSVALMYCIMMCCCLPIIFYSGWVYGDIPSIFFILLMVFMLLRYVKAKKKRYLVGMVSAITMAMLMRTNSLIVLLALSLAVAVYFIESRDKKIAVAALCAILCPFMIQSGIYKMYEIRSGYEHSEGIPYTATLVMGLQENHGVYGWFNNYQKPPYYDSDCDRDAANIIYRRDLKARLEYMKQNPSYALKFFKEKILSQWNQPLFQSVFFATRDTTGYKPDMNILVDKISFLYYDKLLNFCDRLQFIVFVGMGCYFLLAVKGNSNILQHVIAISVIGGFFFSVIWEAKARYIFPYYIMMFPMAAIGYEQLILTAGNVVKYLLSRRKRLSSASCLLA